MSGADVSGDAAGSASSRFSGDRSQQTYTADPKYKKFTQQIEKCLNSFDNVHEWADCIAFLKQMLKTFQSYMQFKEIPHKLIVAKRLAQCLTPALPTGVHQRALDVYAHILAVLGPEGLKRDLPLWSSGLFPFFEYAATSVKPTLLNLFDTHYLPLQAGLRPVMKSFILALLPGLEEEAGEFFEKVLSLLDRLSGTVSVSFFFQNIWLIMLTMPSGRGTSLNFLSRRLPRLNSDEDLTAIVGRDIGLMIRAFSAALEDENLLVRRGALDLLLQSMKVDSIALRKAQVADRTILMRAAIGVVLRRDLSLNRRLYTWLLGPDEKIALQEAYFRDNSLELLRSTLKDDMVSPPGDYPETRPFKIFISLLDKWEIGGPLTEVLVLDAFKATMSLLQAAPDATDEIMMAASTLYEAVEPRILWKQIFTSILGDIRGDGSQDEAIRIAEFLLRTEFPQDEEVMNIYLPLLFAAIAELLNARINGKPSLASLPSLRQSLYLLERMLQHIPSHALLQRPDLPPELHDASDVKSSLSFALAFFGIKPSPDEVIPEPAGSLVSPFSSAFRDLSSLTTSLASVLTDVKEAFMLALSIIRRLAEGVRSTVRISWDPEHFLLALIASLEQTATNFIIVDLIVTLTVDLHHCEHLEPSLSIDKREVTFKLVTKLLRYLRFDASLYHVRATQLIWLLDACSQDPHVESILARTMTSPDPRMAHEAYESFGVLWRLTEDNMLPGFHFKVPLMIVLDSLKTDDPSLRRIGETWMRCSLKSVLDPIIFDLLDPSIHRTPSVIRVKGRELQAFLYDRPFDQRYISHLLESLLSLVRFGGQGFSKAARTAPIKRSYHEGLVQRVTANGFADPNITYLEVLAELLLRFFQTEPSESLQDVMDPLNAQTQSTLVELLQLIVARGEIDRLSVQTIEAVVVGKLYHCIHVGRLNLQNKLLHLLHSLISTSASVEDLPVASLPRQARLTDDQIEEKEPASVYPVNSLLIHTLMDGITTSTNRPVLQHWIDFILTAVPQFQPMLQAVVTPLNDCICKQLRSMLDEVLKGASSDDIQAQDLAVSVSDAEFIMLLGALERLVLVSIANAHDLVSSEDLAFASEKSPQAENTGILGYVSNVFAAESVTQGTDQFLARSPGYRSLHEAVSVLYAIWGNMVWDETVPSSPKNESIALMYTRSRLRCRRVIEHFFRAHTPEVFETIVISWNKELQDNKVPPSVAFELVDALIANAQSAVHMICESISWRLAPVDRTRKPTINPELTDGILFLFLEQYLQQLEGPIAIQVWSRFLQLIKEVVGGTRDFKSQTFPTLRCLVVLAEKITQTPAMEDKRIRKDVQESFGKLLDACIQFVARSFDSGSWIRRTALTTNGRDSPVPRSDSRMDDKLNASVSSLPPDTPRIGTFPTEIIKINEYIVDAVLPNLRRFLIDNEKVVPVCTNLVYYIVSPAMKTRSRPMEIEEPIVAMIREMTRIPSTLKAWKPVVIEVLNDNRLFSAQSATAEKWKLIIRALFEADKTGFTDLLAKITTAPIGNIFTSKEYEMLVRSINLRRLSFILYAGDKNQFLTQLPSVQEKLVEVFKNVSSPTVQCEVFLCIRVLLCRLSPHNLTSFWPVILTELLRLFEQAMSSIPADGSEDLPLILAASKCIDLLLVLQTPEFQIHQWMFITDTVDAIYRPNNWLPEALLDQLAEVVGNLSRASDIPASHSPGLHGSFGSTIPMRQPMLDSLRTIDSIRDLVPFFSSVSISSYESVYASGGNVDWEAVENGLLNDIFDGRLVV